MQHFDKIYARASKRKGGDQALETLLRPMRQTTDLTTLNDAKVLAEMTACIFRAGFVWRVITAKWPGFEKAFHDFDVTRCAMLSDEEIEELTRNTDIVRHGTKIASVRANALYVLDIRAEHGSFGRFMADWPDSDFVGLWMHLKKNGTRLGGQTGRYCLRFLGYDSPILSQDVVAALIAAGVVDKDPSSRKRSAGDSRGVQRLARTKWPQRAGNFTLARSVHGLAEKTSASYSSALHADISGSIQ
jgi:3-methyladenine DNA glycosylase Tag